MKMRVLGKTSLRVSELCLGTMVFGESGSRGTDEDTSIKMIKRFIDVGGNFIDTADVYGDPNGKSEEITGKAIKGHRDELIIASKCRFPMGKGVNQRGLSRKYLFSALKNSLDRLDTSYIDLFYVHCNTLDMSLIETLKALNDLIQTGKIHYIGVSNFRAWEVMKALMISEAKNWARFEAAQYQYSLVERNIEFEFSSLCVSENLGLLPWGPLGGGFLSGKYTKDEKPKEGTRLAVMPDHTEEAWIKRSVERNWKILDVVERIKTNREVTHAQIALNWLLQQPAVVAPIIGARTMEQLEDNLRTVEWRLSQEELKELNKISKPVEKYPYGFIRNYCCD